MHSQTIDRGSRFEGQVNMDTCTCSFMFVKEESSLNLLFAAKDHVFLLEPYIVRHHYIQNSYSFIVILPIDFANHFQCINWKSAELFITPTLTLHKLELANGRFRNGLPQWQSRYIKSFYNFF
jgi:hypothetical protein